MTDAKIRIKKTCPKCGITMAPVELTTGQGSFLIYLGFVSFVQINLHVCTGCGFGEFWVDREDDLQELREKLSSK
jgi:hypothetical protein